MSPQREGEYRGGRCEVVSRRLAASLAIMGANKQEPYKRTDHGKRRDGGESALGKCPPSVERRCPGPRHGRSLTSPSQSSCSPSAGAIDTH